MSVWQCTNCHNLFAWNAVMSCPSCGGSGQFWNGGSPTTSTAVVTTIAAADPTPARLSEGDAAREAVTLLRDFARTHGMDFRERDPLVVAIHDCLDKYEDELRAHRAAESACRPYLREGETASEGLARLTTDDHNVWKRVAPEEPTEAIDLIRRVQFWITQNEQRKFDNSTFASTALALLKQCANRLTERTESDRAWQADTLGRAMQADAALQQAQARIAELERDKQYDAEEIRSLTETDRIVEHLRYQLHGDIRQAWNVLTFQWESMPEPMRQSAMLSCRDTLDRVLTTIDVVKRTPSPLEARIVELEQERDEARRFGEDAARQYNELLATNTAVTCAFCGEVYPEGTPRHGSAVLTEHIRTCQQHPMRALEAKVAALEDAQRWRPIMLAARDGALDLLSGWEDCEDCADICDAYDRACRAHSEPGNKLYYAILEIERALGPCGCGHSRDEHETEDSTACRTCSCGSFWLPPGPTREGQS